MTTSFANAVVDVTIFRPLSTIDTPLPYGCSPLGSFRVGYSDVWSERIPIGCSRAQLKASIGSLPNVNSNGLRVNSQESFLMFDKPLQSCNEKPKWFTVSIRCLRIIQNFLKVVWHFLLPKIKSNTSGLIEVFTEVFVHIF